MKAIFPIFIAYFDTLKHLAFSSYSCFTNYRYFSSFLLSGAKKTCPFRKKTFISLMAKSFLPRKVFIIHYELYFPAIAMWYSSSTIMTMKAPVPQEYKVSVRLFLKFTIVFKKDIFEKYYRKPISTYFDSET